MQIKLGERYRDKITEFEGIATHKVTYLNGCVYYTLTNGYDPATGKDIAKSVISTHLVEPKEPGKYPTF